jgi:CBS domain-containing protein/hemerythrin-like domain-containing protein
LFFTVMTPVQMLRRDHDVIGGVLAALDAVTRAGMRPARVPASLVVAALEFFASFVERCHHAKENVLLARLRHVQSLERLRAEHDEGRERLAAIRSALGEADDVGANAVRLLADYVGFQRDHLAREERTLLPLAERASAAEVQEIDEAFRAIEERELGPEGDEALRQLAAALETSCRQELQRGGGHHEARAADVMRRNAGAVAPSASLAHAAALMDALRVREVPVVEDGRLVGILTRHDLEPYRGHLEWTSVRAAMTTAPRVASPDMAVREIARLLLDHHINAVPIVAAGTLVGMVRRSDLLHLVAGDPV